MIGQSTSITGQTAVSYPTYEGVAPEAFLVSTASGTFDEVDLAESLNRTAKQFGNLVRAVNMSFSKQVSFPAKPNGTSYLSLFLDWSARQHDVLYVGSWGNTPTSAAERSPADMFNGIVVGASEQISPENVWRKFSDVNSTNGLGGNTFDETMHIDLLAPGKNMHVLQENDTAKTSAMGTSYSAPLVTGSVALLNQFIAQPGNTGNYTNATKHQVIKAILMNSADKIAGVHGSHRTALDSNNQDWTQSEANLFTDALDDQLGTGLLNVRRAVQQLEPGKFGPGAPIPLIGWDYGVIPDNGQDIVYTFNQPFGGDYLSVTLAYDRPVFCTCFDEYTPGSQFLAEAIPDVDIIIQQVGGPPIDADTDQFLTVEHTFTHVLAQGEYQIILRRNFDFAESTNYGLAWWYGPPPGLAGDYNGDGSVGAADYVLWRIDPGSFGGAGGYDVWRQNFGAGSGTGNSFAAVPEPTANTFTLQLLLLGGAIVCQRKLRRDPTPSRRRTMSSPWRCRRSHSVPPLGPLADSPAMPRCPTTRRARRRMLL
jgi:hypothetical protein